MPPEGFNPSAKTPGEDMFIEAKMYEIVKQYPHPNICHYYGCIRDGQGLTSICLRKYKWSLYDAVRSGAPLDHDVIVSGIAKWLHFLHDTLGLAHNDIALDDQGHPVIIDFDSCAPIWQDMDGGKGGTFGWVREPEPRTCNVESDDYALSLIAQYLDGKVDRAIPVHNHNMRSLCTGLKVRIRVFASGAATIRLFISILGIIIAVESSLEITHIHWDTTDGQGVEIGLVYVKSPLG